MNFSFPQAHGRQSISSLPETQLMALVVVAVKLYHPFDDLPRNFADPPELGALSIDWDAWCEGQASYESRETSAGSLGRGNAIKIREEEVSAMSDQHIDEFLDWYEKTWVTDPDLKKGKRRLPTELLDMFPTGDLNASLVPVKQAALIVEANEEALASKLDSSQAHLRFPGVVSEDRKKSGNGQMHKLGAFYKRYRREEELPPRTKVFFEAAADLIGVSLHTLMLAVFKTEQKLLQHRAAQISDCQQLQSDMNEEYSSRELSGLINTLA